MPFDSPIASLRESYRPEPDAPTVVMPVLIGCVAVALAVFYFKTRPASESEATAAPMQAAPMQAAPIQAAPMLVAKPIETQVTEETPAAPLRNEAPAPSSPPPASVSEADFTPWLSPLALDTYLRAKSRGSHLNFWQQGHWIRAVEGRWQEGALELRLAIGRIAPGHRFRWQYRVDMTETEYTEAYRRLEGEGFRLVQSHAYSRPGGEIRHQAVWRSDSGDERDKLLRR